MRIPFSACKQAQPLVSFAGGLNMEPFISRRRKNKVAALIGGAASAGKSRHSIDLATRFPAEILRSEKMQVYKGLDIVTKEVVERRRKGKVVVVMGATGTGKSRLSIDLATRFPAEIVNSDKMQVYKGLDIVTNKVTEEECRGVPHHLLGVMDPYFDFTAVDFKHHALLAIESIVKRHHLPIIAGGSNSYIKALVNDNIEFNSKYDCCFLWVDVSLPVLHSFVSERVDRMVEMGLVDEVRGIFDQKADYKKGIRHAIGVSEMDRFLRAETKADDENKALILKEAIEEIKSNTCKLACYQLQNILRLKNQLGWNLHRLDATEAFLKRRGSEADAAWEKLVARPSRIIVDQFLYEEDLLAAPTSISAAVTASVVGTTLASATAVAAATH